MPLYQCFFDRFDGAARGFLVIDADDDARACIEADDHLTANHSYRAAKVYADDRCIGRIERGHAGLAPFLGAES